jgi:hypothetical protein
LFHNIDARTTWGRRFHALVNSFANELGGLAQLSESDAVLVRSAASLICTAEQRQAQAVRGEPVNAAEIVKLTSESRRCLDHVRRRREQPKTMPSLAEYLARRREAAA